MTSGNPCVVTQACHDCKYTDCVTVCPADCFYQDENQLYIDPIDCVDCGKCVAECPVEAIYELSQLPADSASYAQINADRSAKLKQDPLNNISEGTTPKKGPGCKDPSAG